MNGFCEQFKINNEGILIEIIDVIEKHDYNYHPCSGLLENIDKTKNNKEPFFFHYITDKYLLGVNGIRESEKLVIPLSINLKLDEDFYYIDERTNYIYEYKLNILQPLTVHYYIKK